MARVFSTTGVTSRGPTLDDVDFVLSYTPLLTEVSGGTGVNSTVLDRNIRTTTGATIKTEAVVTAQELVFDAFSRAGLVIESLSPSIASITVDGNEAVLTRLSNGTARILYKTPWLFREISVPVSLTAGASGVEFLSYTSGTLADHVSDSLDALIVSNQDQEVFASGVRNTGVWTQADMSSHQVWNSHTGGPQGVAISPLHTISPYHYITPTGTTVRFIGNDNSVNERTISSQMQIGGTDLLLNKLSSALPATVVPAKTLPSGYIDYLPSIDVIENYRSAYTIPGFYINKFSEAHVIECGIANNSIYVYQALDSFPDRHDMYTLPVGGDSGSPVCVIINDEVVVLTTLHTPGSGPAIVNNYAAINAGMTTLGGGYQLTDVSVSGFTSF